MGYIYILTSPSGRSYIGQTTRPIEIRFIAHQFKSSPCIAIRNAIQKYGWENFEKDWYECPDEDLNFDEELLIREMETLSPNGYNLKEGGGNGKLSDEARKKISEAQQGEKNHNYGKTPSDETKQKSRDKQIGKTLSDKTKQKMRESHIGTSHTDETKQKISESRQGEKHPMYGKTGEKSSRSKKVYQYDSSGNILGSFGSCEEAAREMKKGGSSTISRCANGKIKTAYGFKWSYKN